MRLGNYEWNPEKDMIAEGAFAEVFRASDINTAGRTVAFKIYKEAVAKGTSGSSGQKKYTLEQEFRNVDGLSHTNIIAYYGLDYIHHIDALGRQTSYPVLIMEYAEGGTLTDYLKTNPDGCTLDKLVLDIIQGVGYLHSEGILHRDLKPGNILITKNRRGEPVAKITDFGISRDLLTDKTIEQSYTEGIGTPLYMAPEQFYKKRFGLNGELSERTDIWAIGVVVYRMITGHLPFGEGVKDYEQTREAILEEQPDFRIIPEPYQELIRHCLVKTAADRWAGTKKMLLMLEGKAGDPRSSGPIKGDEITTIENVGDVELPSKGFENGKPVLTFKNRRPLLIGSFCLFFALIAVLGYVFLYENEPVGLVEFQSNQPLKSSNFVNFNSSYEAQSEDKTWVTHVSDYSLFSINDFMYLYRNTDGSDLRVRTTQNELFVNEKLRSVKVDSAYILYSGLLNKDLGSLDFLEIGPGLNSMALSQIEQIIQKRPDLTLTFEEPSSRFHELQKQTRPNVVLGIENLIHINLDQLKVLVITENKPLSEWIDIDIPDLKHLIVLQEVHDHIFSKVNTESITLMIEDLDLEIIQNHENLKALHLLISNSVRNFNAWSNFDQLKYFEYKYYGGNDDSQLPVYQIKDLKSLTLPVSSTNDLQVLVDNNPDLEHLGLIDFTDGLEPLTGLKKLKSIVLDNFAVDSDLEPLKEISSLSHIGISGLDLNDHNLLRENLKKACPQCVIYQTEIGVCLGSGWLLLLLPFSFLFVLINWLRK